MKLWGGESDTGCCSVSDVDDARRVADHLRIEHHVFNFGDAFEADVIAPYVEAHRQGRTPNPCIECNRHIKFHTLIDRADRLGFERVATGHHAAVRSRPDGTVDLLRGADSAKDQSYVLAVVGQSALARTLLPLGAMTKAEVRRRAADLGLRTAAKPDSQDVCFIRSDEGRAGFLGERTAFTPARVVSGAGEELGTVPALELVTVGQRRGLAIEPVGEPRYVTDVDVASATVTIGARNDLRVDSTPVGEVSWCAEPHEGPVLAQSSAHGESTAAALDGGTVRWDAPRSRVAPGQTVAFYDVIEPDRVLGAATAVSLR
jgi:tRNA-specific 2-thiouridylase